MEPGIKLVHLSGKRQLQATVGIPDISGETICNKLVGNVIYFEEVLSEIMPNYCEVLLCKPSVHIFSSDTNHKLDQKVKVMVNEAL